MSKDLVADEVVTKLWQVYSASWPAFPDDTLARADIQIAGTTKDIPRFQRRGAIIVLGMFAAPKPEVVAEHIDTLLKIGLGPYGKVRLLNGLPLIAAFLC